MVTSLYYTYSTIPLWNILSMQSSSLGKHKVQTSAEVILCLWPCIGSPLKIGTGYQWGTQKSQACIWWMLVLFLSFLFNTYRANKNESAANSEPYCAIKGRKPRGKNISWKKEFFSQKECEMHNCFQRQVNTTGSPWWGSW